MPSRRNVSRASRTPGNKMVRPVRCLRIDVEHRRLLAFERLRRERFAGRIDGALDQLLDTIADHRGDGRNGQRPTAAAGQQLVDRGRDIRRRIDQRAVKVEQDGARPIGCHDRSSYATLRNAPSAAVRIAAMLAR